MGKIIKIYQSSYCTAEKPQLQVSSLSVHRSFFANAIFCAVSVLQGSTTQLGWRCSFSCLNEYTTPFTSNFPFLLRFIENHICFCYTKLRCHAFTGGTIMWLLFGSIAIIAAILNVIWTIRHHEAKWFRFISLSFTIFSLCAFYGQAKQWVLTGAADQLLDVMPTLSIVLWFLAVASVLINSISLFKRSNK